MEEGKINENTQYTKHAALHIQSMIAESMKLSARIIGKIEGIDANEVYEKAINDAVKNTQTLAKDLK